MLVLSSLQVGRPREIHEQPRWRTAFFKAPPLGPVHLGRENLDGDQQADLRVHGGPDKAVCAYPGEHYETWKRETGIAECGPGWFGENFTLAGATETDVCVGDAYRVGSATIQVSQPRGPCFKLARRWGLPDFVATVVASGRTGWYFRVIEEGTVAAGDALARIDRPYPRWTIARVNELTYDREASAADRAALAGCPALAATWRASLRRRLSE